MSYHIISKTMLHFLAIGTTEIILIVLAIVLLFGVLTYLDYREDKALARLYGGSYVIDNGHRIDDLGRIKGDIEAALADAEHIESRIGRRSVVEQVELDVLGSIDDPDMRRQVEEMLE